MTKHIDVNLINGIALAFEGDAVYSLYIRRHLIFQGQTKPNQLHRLATCYVSAKAQASLIEKMLERELLTEKELDIYKRVVMLRVIPKLKIRMLLPIKCQQASRQSWVIFI